jgi:hypothetical protein
MHVLSLTLCDSNTIHNFVGIFYDETIRSGSREGETVDSLGNAGVC